MSHTKTPVLQVANILAYITTIIVNYLSNTGIFNNTTIGKVSGQYRTLFTPAGYAFSIWGLIYLLLLGFVVFQARGLFSGTRQNDVADKSGPWFLISCVFNSLWVVAWTYEFTGLSVICIFLLLFSLIRMVQIHRMELWDAPIAMIAFLWWPFVIYSGWVTVASIANVSAWLEKIGWNGIGISDTSWTVIMIVIALIINLLVTWQRNMCEFTLVGAWALTAISVANQGIDPVVQYMAIIAAVILVISSLLHGWKNRSTNPLIKLLQVTKR